MRVQLFYNLAMHGVQKIQKGEGKGQNVANRLSSPSVSKRVPYHGVLPMAEWLKRSAFTQKARVRSRTKKSFFILLSKAIKIFTYPYFYTENTMALLFFHEKLEKIEK